MERVIFWQATDGSIEERFLRYASRRVQRTEREEKASARFGRNDSVVRLWRVGGCRVLAVRLQSKKQQIPGFARNDRWGWPE